jgi:hypothetical protein
MPHLSRLRFVRPLVVIAYSAILAACVTAVQVRPIGTVQGSTRYRVSCQDQSACDAEIAKMCAAGHFTDSFKSDKPMAYTFSCTSGRPRYSPGSSPQTVQIAIPPECKNMMYGPDFLAGARDRPRPDFLPWDPGRAKAFFYIDPRSKITLHVESDGRQLAAMDSSGKLLWIRNPFEDAGLCPYRSPHPVIVEIDIVDALPDYGERVAPYFKKLGMLPSHKYIQIHFDSSQFGLIDESSGNFFFLKAKTKLLASTSQNRRHLALAVLGPHTSNSRAIGAPQW